MDHERNVHAWASHGPGGAPKKKLLKGGWLVGWLRGRKGIGWCLVAGGWSGRLRWARTGPEHISPHERAFPSYADQLVSQCSASAPAQPACRVAVLVHTPRVLLGTGPLVMRPRSLFVFRSVLFSRRTPFALRSFAKKMQKEMTLAT